MRTHLDGGQEVGQDDGVDPLVVVERHQVREAVQQRAAAHHAQVGDSEELEWRKKREKMETAFVLCTCPFQRDERPRRYCGIITYKI